MQLQSRMQGMNAEQKGMNANHECKARMLGTNVEHECNFQGMNATHE